jgi:hypothetical protein
VAASARIVESTSVGGWRGSGNNKIGLGRSRLNQSDAERLAAFLDALRRIRRHVRRGHRLEAQYSLSPPEYQALFVAEDGRCHLCGRKSPTRPTGARLTRCAVSVRIPSGWGCNLKIVARSDAYPQGPLAFAIRMVEYFREPPARKIIQRQDEK